MVFLASNQQNIIMKTTLLCKQAIFLKRNGFKAILTLFLLGTLTGTSQTQIGQDINGEAAGDRSGQAVSMSDDGSIVAIGTLDNDGNGENSGHVRVFENQNGSWVQLGQDIDGEAAGDESGTALSLSGDGSILAIGARVNNGSGSASGHARIFENVNGSWVQIGQDINGEAAGDVSGDSVSLSEDGSIVAIGATANDGNGSASGHVRVFQNVNGNWVQIGQDIDGEAAIDLSGDSVSLSADGSMVAIGADGNDGNGNASGHVRAVSYTHLTLPTTPYV